MEGGASLTRSDGRRRTLTEGSLATTDQKVGGSSAYGASVSFGAAGLTDEPIPEYPGVAKLSLKRGRLRVQESPDGPG
jgi:hypothetical protein